MLKNRDSGRVVVADVTKIIHMSSAANNMVIPDSGYASWHPHSLKSELCVYILRSSMSKSSNRDLSAKKTFFRKFCGETFWKNHFGNFFRPAATCRCASPRKQLSANFEFPTFFLSREIDSTIFLNFWKS